MRYLPHTSTTREAMLNTIGVTSVDALFEDVPTEARLKNLINLPHHQSEYSVEQAFQELANRNHRAGDGPFFVGAGAYRHHIPAAVDHLIQRGEFLTSYTPYQPEISQGTLQYLFEFQTQVALLTGMDIANASMYDGATATVEAVMMANRITNRKKAVISGGLHPHYREVIETYARFSDFEVIAHPPTIPSKEDLIAALASDISCVVVQYPNFFGELEDLSALAEACQKAGALLVVAVTEIVALGLVESPGAMGADIVVGEGLSLGVGLNFGGPTVGLFATREKYLRQMPGRLVGETTDVDGNRGWVLTLSTREQHIRREKATSNICTNSGLCSLAFTIHMSLLGEVGLKRLARLNHSKAIQLVDRLKTLPDIRILNQSFFNEITVDLSRPAAPIVEALAAKGILAGVPFSRFSHDLLDPRLLIAVTEMCKEEDMDSLVRAMRCN